MGAGLNSQANAITRITTARARRKYGGLASQNTGSRYLDGSCLRRPQSDFESDETGAFSAPFLLEELSVEDPLPAVFEPPFSEEALALALARESVT